MEDKYLLHSEPVYRNGKWIGHITAEKWRWNFIDEIIFDEIIHQIFNQEDK